MLKLNLLFVYFIIAAGVLYFYFKTKQFRTTRLLPIRKKMFASLAGIALGSMLVFFGLNQFVLFDGMTTYIVATIFILLGAYASIFNFKAYRHYKQFVDEELALNKN